MKDIQSDIVLPEKEKNRFSLQNTQNNEQVNLEIKEIQKYIEQCTNNNFTYIKPVQFQDIFKKVISRTDVYLNTAEDLELALEDTLNDDVFEMKYGEMSNKDYKDKIQKDIQPYISIIKKQYSDSNFSQKNNILNFIDRLYSVAMFSGTMNLRRSISQLGKEMYEVEKKEDGNHYIFLHVKKLVESGDDHKDMYTRVGPQQYITGTKKELYISEPKDFLELAEIIPKPPLLFKESCQLEEKISEKYKRKTKQGDVIHQPLEICKKNSNDPDCIRYITIKKEEEKINNRLNELFSNRLEDYLKSRGIKNFDTDFLFFQLESLKEAFKEKSSIDLQSFALNEQYNFFEYTKEAKNSEAEKLYSFCRKYKEAGFRTFLSVEHGSKEMGDKILAIGDRLPENTAKEIFEKYGQIVDNVNNIITFAKNNFKQEIKTDPELIRKIEETLFTKAKQLLLQMNDRLEHQNNMGLINISNELSRINADTITTFSIFKQAVRNGEELPIESIEGSIFSKKNASEFDITQVEEMVQLYEENWKNHPDKEFASSLKAYFKTAFLPRSNQEKNYFYTFEKDDHIRAFVRFEEKPDDSLYASALNVDEASKSFGLGEAMMDEALVREAKEHILHASCRKDNPSNMRYFEKGFISNGFKKTHETEEFDLIWDEKKNAKILSKQKTVNELIAIYLKGGVSDGIEIRKASTLELLHKGIPFGKSMTRCFMNPQKNGWYAVYEDSPPGYGVNEGETK